MSVVLSVENVSKQYRLGLVGSGTLREDLMAWWYRMRGLEDPTLMIGEENDRTKTGDSNYVWALRDINFEVQQGEVLGIIGKNGAGKSTLLKLLSRVTAPTTGSIKAKGRIASLLEVGTGFHPELTGRENIFLNGAIMGMNRHEIKRKLDEIVAFAGVERYLDTPVKRYSSGMYVRLAFAVAAHLEPEILIVDEVLAVGDSEFQKKALKKMREVSSGEGRTVLFVSHNMASVRTLCSRSILLRNGSLVMDGTTGSVVEHYLNNRESESHQLLDSENAPVTLNNIEIIDQNGNSSSTVQVGSSTSVGIEYESSKDLKEVSIGFGIDDESDNRIVTYWTEFKNMHFELKKGVNHVRFNIPSVKLIPGVYSISTYCESQGKVVEGTKTALRFVVSEIEANNDFIAPSSKLGHGIMVDDFEFEVMRK